MQIFQGRLSKDVDPAVVQTEWDFLARRNSIPPADLVFRGDAFQIRLHTEVSGKPCPAEQVQRNFSRAVFIADEKCSIIDFEEVS